MSNVPDGILRKLQALERMANAEGGATENEIEQALAHIRRIRDEYDISEAEAFRTPETVSIIEEESREWNRLIPWMEMLAWVPAELCDCRWFIRNKFKGYTARGRPKYYKAIIFVGTPRDAATASGLYQFLYSTVRIMGTMRFGGGNWNVSHTSYAEGIISTLRERVRFLRQNADNVTPGIGAIVLVKDRAVDDYMCGLGLKRGKALKRRSFDHSANAAGRVDGKKVDLNRSDRVVKGSRQRTLPGA